LKRKSKLKKNRGENPFAEFKALDNALTAIIYVVGERRGKRNFTPYHVMGRKGNRWGEERKTLKERKGVVGCGPFRIVRAVWRNVH